MISLGIESTAHTFGVGIVENDNILANEKDIFKTSKGILPREASDHHVNVAHKLIKQALDKANLSIRDIDIISYSQGPGLHQCLSVGQTVAKYLALKYQKPLVGVNHCIAHLLIGKIFGIKDPVMLYASGANTQIIAYKGGKYRVFGETLDIGVGNLIDVFGRELKIGFPAGPKVEELAKKGNYIELPYVVKGMDVSFGGILSNLKRKVKEGYKKEDLCYSLQETVFSMLIEVAERAMAHTQKKEILLTGGVAANKRFQEMCKIMAKERNAKCFTLPNSLVGDNGVMIAYAGFFFKPFKKIKNIEVKPKWRTDEVNV